jgi:peptidoglycan/LPS O-acetylase OafA/YrhL
VWWQTRPAGDSALFQLVANTQADLAFGVTLFFTLSGFLLYRPFVAALMRAEPRPSFERYLRNRALRIAPAYWVILLVSALILRSVAVRNADGERVLSGIDDPITLAKHMLLVQGYEPSGVVTGIGPAWSLAVELVFYLALPLLALAAWALARRASTRAGRRLAALGPALLLLAIGLAGKMVATHFLPDRIWSGGWGGDWHSVLVRSFLCQADLFSFGMALAVVRVDVEDGLVRVSALGRRAVGALCLGVYLVTARMTDASDQLGITPYNTLMALACALFLALVVLVGSDTERPALVRVLELRPLVAVGLVSYSLFLWHEPLIGWLAVNGLAPSGRAGFLVTLFLTVAVGFVLSVLTYRLVELPALRRKRRTRTEGASVGALEASAAP